MYKELLEVSTEADQPYAWAMTQRNLALLEEAKSNHDTCRDPAPHRAAALAYLAAAERIQSQANMPREYVVVNRIRGRIEEKQRRNP